MQRLGFVLAGMLIVGSGWAQDPFGLEVLRADLPAAMGPGEKRQVEVTMVNRGAFPWSPELGFFVAAHWYHCDGDEMVWEGPRTRLPMVVGPGEAVTVDVHIVAPAEEGPALIQFDVVQEGVFWLSRRAQEPAELMSILIKRSHGFSLLESQMPGSARAGNRVQVLVRLRNEGLVTWEPDGSFAIAAHWRRPEEGEAIWEGLRTRFPHQVGPGESVLVLASTEIPARSGRWLLDWDVVHEGVCWFSESSPERPRPDVVVVLPACAEGWPAVLMTLAMAVAAIGFAQGWWGKPRYGRNLDLFWMVATPWIVERAVVDISFVGGVVSLLCLVFMAAVVGLLPIRLRPFAAWLSGAAVIALLVADRVYLRFFQDLPSVASFAGFGQTDQLGDSIASLANPGDAALLGAGLLGVLVSCAVSRISVGSTAFPRRLLISGIALVCAVLTLTWVARAPALQQVFRRVFVAQEIGVVGSHWVDIGGWFRRKMAKHGLPASEVEHIERWFRRRAIEPRAQEWPFGAARGLNVIMIQAESLQSFVPGLFVEGQEVTPTLNRWLRDSLVFDRVTDQTGHGRSSDAELLTQVSLLPLADGAAAFAAAGNRFTSLAGVMAQRGYFTLSAVPFDRTFWNRSVTHKAYGYSQSLFAEDFAPGETVGWGLSDREFLGRMGRRLADLPEPFCVWLITLSLHHPFDGFPEELEELDVGRWQGSPVGAYLHTMRYLDHALADLQGELRASGLLESTMIALWGDHDAGFEWTPEVATLMGVSADNTGWYISQRVPFIIRLPTRTGIRGTRSDPAGHVDVAPTLAALLGVDPGLLAWMGRDLLAPHNDEPVVGEYDCWMDSKHLFLQGDGTLGGGECLDGADFVRQPPAACADAFQEAKRRIDIAQRILRHDLQEELTAALQKDRP